MADILDDLVNVIVRDSADYDLNFLIIEVEGAVWSRIRVDSGEQVRERIDKVLEELELSGATEYKEDDAIEFGWYLVNGAAQEVNLYLI